MEASRWGSIVFSKKSLVKRGIRSNRVSRPLPPTRFNNPSTFREKNPSSPFLSIPGIVRKLEGGRRIDVAFYTVPSDRFSSLCAKSLKFFYTRTRFSSHEREKVFSVFRAKGRRERGIKEKRRDASSF